MEKRDQREWGSRRRGVSAVPVVGDLLAMVRLLRDSEARRWTKVVVVVTLLYVVWPLDAIPEITPWLGLLDDAGLFFVARLVLHQALKPYRYPLGHQGRSKLLGGQTTELPSVTSTP